MKKINHTFQGADPTWANACVGNNGDAQIIEYARGFSSAANILLDQVVDSNGIDLNVDEFIYPICFNMRHAVELFLKSSVDKIRKICEHGRPVLQFDNAGSHDLGKIWAYVKENSISIDRRYVRIIGKLDQYIVDIASIDSNGQVFRYPFDLDSKKHLTDVAIINVVTLKKRFNVLEKLLNSLDALNDELKYEYSWNTFTSKLSRYDLFQVARELPYRSDWNTEQFTACRKHVMKERALSSKDFSKAVEIIGKHYEMAQFVVAPLKLSNVTIEVLFVFFDAWCGLHDIDNVKQPKTMGILTMSPSVKREILANIKEGDKIKTRCWDRICGILQPNVLAELEALFYFYSELNYCEIFISLREDSSRILTEKFDSNMPDYRFHLFHLLDKTNALHNILNSINFLGQTEMLESLVARYGLAGCSSRLLKSSIENSWKAKYAVARRT